MIPTIHSRTYWLIFSVIVIGSLVGVIFNHYLPDFLREGVYVVASYWLAAMAYFTIFMVIIDIINLADRWFRFIPMSVKTNSNILFLTGLLVFVTVTSLLIYGTINAKDLKVTPYNINVAKHAGSLDKLHIALILDVHLSDLNDESMKSLVDTINEIEPDIVLIAGDIIDASRDIEPYNANYVESNFNRIKAKYGVYASLGNHDYDYNGDSSYKIDSFKKAGVNILRDGTVKIDESFYIIGREDKSYERISGEKRMDLTVLMDGMDKKLPMIVLDHQPINLDEPKSEGVDLQVSGHTHKGQLFPFSFITERIFQIDYGYLNLGDFNIVVSSGARTWGPPVRIGTHSEVVDITINFQ